jgi:hypothetical protein
LGCFHRKINLFVFIAAVLSTKSVKTPCDHSVFVHYISDNTFGGGAVHDVI